MSENRYASECIFCGKILNFKARCSRIYMSEMSIFPEKIEFPFHIHDADFCSAVCVQKYISRELAGGNK